jgi:hypothetical protein
LKRERESKRYMCWTKESAMRFPLFRVRNSGGADMLFGAYAPKKAVVPKFTQNADVCRTVAVYRYR